ncbi:MAG: ATP-binding protein [Polyangiaceae bacterium]
MLSTYVPKVNTAKELAEISKDFTNPRELVREAIANSLDASASAITIEAFRDDASGEEELVVRVTDNGLGMTLEELQGFFDLGFSNKRNREGAIGHKGHGTKITYNSSLVTVYSRSIDGGPMHRAVLSEPRKALNRALRSNGEPPGVEISLVDRSGVRLLDDAPSGTVIEVRGYDGNNWSAFAHDPLRDYIEWFTAWGRIHSAWDETLPAPCILKLRGIGQTELQEVPYGHPFPPQHHDFRSLRKEDERRPENYFVRRWVSEPIKVDGFPDDELRIVFSVEGDSAKRAHNIMLKRVGRPTGKPFPYESARYTVSERYGIYVCRDFIPIERKNERFADRSEWTKWHAFINCQSFSLTANRASVENTRADRLQAIYRTAEKYINDHILGSDEYEEFARRIELEAGRRKAEREKKDVVRRHKESLAKRRLRATGDGKTMDFLEPRTEQGVLWLLARLVTLWPAHFPDINVIDLDSHFGYDLLVLRKHHLTGAEEPAFVELKHNLRDSKDFNHSFEYVSMIVCWESNLHPEEELVDIQDRRRVFKVAQPDGEAEKPHTRYFLNNPSGGRNIEVLVLRKYLEEILGMKDR